MALDAQTNWDVEMSQPLRMSRVRSNAHVTAPSETTQPKVYNATEVLLPIEIIQHILGYIPHRQVEQRTFWACCLVSRAWYSAAVSALYEWPFLGGSNFQTFVATVCPSKNAHIRRSQLAELVRKLDMGELVHDGSKSLTARLLGRLKGSLLEFVAPQASFSINSFAALSKCVNLKHLDLSLMSASISLKSLFHTLSALTELETLFFPRTSVHESTRGEEPYAWPPLLKALHLAGGIDDKFLRIHVCNVPLTLERLSIQHCAQVYSGALQSTLERLGNQLKHLTIRHPMNRMHRGALDRTLTWCPRLEALRISVDYITESFFDEEIIPQGHPLQIIDLDCSSSAGVEVEIHPACIWVAIDSGCLPLLRSVRVSARLAWQATRDLRKSVSELVQIMEEQEECDPTGIEPGVWSIIS